MISRSPTLLAAAALGFLLSAHDLANAQDVCGGGQGSCCEVHDTPGCSDFACCLLICKIDPFCCDIAWDVICVERASILCNGCAMCYGDINGDGVVDSADLSILLAQWGVSVPAGSSADLQPDGTIDASDLTSLIGAWGGCP